MADIELVIKIPEGLKNEFESEQWTALSCMEMKEALIHGTPLPKGHGALKDADEVFAVMERNLDMQDLYLPVHFKQFALDEAKTIVPSDKEGAE